MGYILMNSSVLFIFVAVARHLQRLHKGGRSILANSPGGYSLLRGVQPWHWELGESHLVRTNEKQKELAITFKDSHK